MNPEEFKGDSNTASQITDALGMTGIPAFRVETASRDAEDPTPCAPLGATPQLLDARARLDPRCLCEEESGTGRIESDEASE